MNHTAVPPFRALLREGARRRRVPLSTLFPVLSPPLCRVTLTLFQKYKVRINEKTKENKRIRENQKNRLKFGRKSVDIACPAWYHTKAEFIYIGGKDNVNLYGKIK